MLVSVIIPTYGRPSHLLRAVHSVLNSCYKLIEVIVVDDNDPSSKFRSDTEYLMEKFSDFQNVIYLKHDKNKNGAAARNTGLKYCAGKYVCFLDDDDEFLPKKLTEQVQFLEKNTKYGGCYCKTLYSVDGRLVRKSKFSKHGDFSEDVFMLRAQCNTSSFLFRSEVLFSLAGFDESYHRHQDVELLIRFFDYYLMGFVDGFYLKRHLDSRINMPTPEQYIEIKNKFFIDFGAQIKKFPIPTQKKIQACHDADVFFYCLRNFKLGLALRFYPGFHHVYMYFSSNFSKLPVIMYRKFTGS